MDKPSVFSPFLRATINGKNMNFAMFQELHTATGVPSRNCIYMAWADLMKDDSIVKVWHPPPMRVNADMINIPTVDEILDPNGYFQQKPTTPPTPSRRSSQPADTAMNLSEFDPLTAIGEPSPA